MRTIWYMGSKASLIPGFIAEGVDVVTPRGGTVLDLFSGGGSVAASLASRYTVLANDVQDYSATTLAAMIAHEPEQASAFAASLDFQSDIAPAFSSHSQALSETLGELLSQESKLLGAIEGQGSKSAGPAHEQYRDFCAQTPIPYQKKLAASTIPPSWRSAAPLFKASALNSRRRAPSRAPYHLCLSYYGNIYFGLAQSLEIDSLRFAIDQITGPFAAEKKRHYLAALLFASSISTSGTSHFAQPRALTRASELRAVASRRGLSILAQTKHYAHELAGYIAATPFRRGNRVIRGEALKTLDSTPEPIDTVYADPPYTSDNYSRFYHVLEVLARYDYPTLQLKPDSSLTKGRYPLQDYRFGSGFCSAIKVESEFQRLINSVARRRASLVLSYARPTGLLFKSLRRSASARDAEKRFLELFRSRFEQVSLEARAHTHSGQGEASRAVEELLVICRRPRRNSRRELA